MRLDRLPDSVNAPAPLIHPETAPFWTALSAGELRLQACTRCGTYRYPFAPVCHKCQSFESNWEPVSPEGTVAVAVRVRRATGDAGWADHVPFLSGLVDMEHDLRLPGRIACSCGEGATRETLVRAVVMASVERGDVLGFAHGCVPSPTPRTALPEEIG